MISTILIIGFVMFACLKIVNRKVLQAERILIEQYPTWQNFNKNLDRNLLKVIIGSSYAYRHRKTFEADRHWCLPKDNISAQFEILKHFYSIIKTNGEVNLILSRFEILERPKNVYLPFHYRILQPALLPTNKHGKYLYYPILNIGWAVQILNIRCFNNRKSKASNEEIIIPSETEDIIKEIQEFCNSRDLKFKLIVPDVNYQIEL